jgi:DNA-binding PadR family transcriptional regulator
MGWWCKGDWHGHGHHGRAGWAWGRDAGEDAPALGDRGWLALALTALEESAGSGYDVVQRLETRLEGVYTIPASAVYPVLRMAEDAGFVKAETADGKTTYALTDAGRAYLVERREALDAFWGRVEAARYRQEVGDLFREFKRLAWTVREEAGDRKLDRDRLARIKAALEAARKAIGDDLAG